MIKLVIDSSCDISEAEAKELGVTLIPIKVNFDEDEYLAGVNLKNEEFFKMLKEHKNLPKTAQINQTEYIQVIKPLIDEGHQVFVMALSSGLSGTFNNLRLASEEINSENLKIFDTENATMTYYALVMEAVKLIKSGVSFDELEKKMHHLKSKVKLLAIIDNVKYLIKGGRLSLAKGLLVAALKIKPIVSFIKTKLQMVAKAIGYNNAKAKICNMINNVDTNLPIYYGNSNAEEKGDDFKNTLQEKFGFTFAKKCSIGPVVGTHAGPGCVGVVYFEK